MIAGKDISRTGSAGIPRDIADREKKTVVWYTSFFANTLKNDNDIGVGEIEMRYDLPAIVDSSHECYEWFYLATSGLREKEQGR